MPELENTYEEIKPTESKISLYEEIPDDLRKVSSSPAFSAPSTPNGFRNSWGGQQGKQKSHEAVQRTPSKTLHSSYSEDSTKDALLYEAMNRQEQFITRQNGYSSPQAQQQEDSYVCIV